MTMQRWTVRSMKTEDLEQVSRLEAQIFSMPWSRESLEEALEKENTIYLTAEQEGRVLGYCGLWSVLDEGEITNVAVAPEARGQGIGRSLVEALLQEGRKQGISLFFLEVREHNGSARRLYERCGFREDGVRKNFYEKPRENAVLMSYRYE